MAWLAKTRLIVSHYSVASVMSRLTNKSLVSDEKTPTISELSKSQHVRTRRYQCLRRNLERDENKAMESGNNKLYMCTAVRNASATSILDLHTKNEHKLT